MRIFNGKIGRRDGFTLTELLTVVLVIGVLAAAALPQYRLAVGKARFTQGMVLAQAIAKAQQRYYMANGEYARDWAALDVTLPGGGTAGAWADDGITYETDKIFCRTSFTHYSTGCNLKGSLYVTAIYTVLSTGHYCLASSKEEGGISLGKKICIALGGIEDHGGPNDSDNSSYYTYYKLP